MKYYNTQKKARLKTNQEFAAPRDMIRFGANFFCESDRFKTSWGDEN